jgi:hypothetical protein
MRVRSKLRAGAIGLALAGLAAAAPEARAADLWRQTGQSFTSIAYWQGIAFDPATRSFFFDGPSEGIWRTDASLNRTASRGIGIPAAVTIAHGWNHLGDLTFAERQGAQPSAVLVPLECYYPVLSDPNTCKTGGVGVINPATLAWRYDVVFGGIAKAMWVEASPDGTLLWTSAGTDLVAYDAGQVTSANAGRTLAPVRRLARVLPSASVSGAAFAGNRLYLAFDLGSSEQVQSAPLDASGNVLPQWQPEIQRTKSFGLYESEGLAFASALGGTLHWQIQPELPFYTRILHFVPAAVGQ